MERITREDLRNMAMGETRTFDLPNAQQCDNGKSTAWNDTPYIAILTMVASNSVCVRPTIGE